MAFRSSATAFSNTGSVTLTATPAGVAVDDRLLGFFVQDSTGHVSAKPTGWTDESLQEQSGPDGQTFDLYSKKAVGGDSFATGVVVDANSCRFTTAAWSGRHTVTAITLNTAQKNTSTASAMTLSTANATSGTFGVTSAAGDDVVVFAQVDKITISDVWGFDNNLSGFTEDHDDDNDWLTASLYYKNNAAGGGDGSLSLSATRSTGASNAGWGAFVVAIKPLAAVGGPGASFIRLNNGTMKFGGITA